MYTYINHTIGHAHSINETMPFLGSDSEEEFRKSKLRMPNDWRWVNKQIDYTFNENGHRSPSATPYLKSSPNPNPYILFTGCSNTEGYGLPTEDMFSFKSSKLLGLDYYNLALGASGIDLVLENLIQWTTHYHLPKAVVVQLPNIHRMSTQVTFPNGEPMLVPLGPWDIEMESMTQHKYAALVKSESFEHIYKIMYHSVRAIVTALNIPILFVRIDNTIPAEIVNVCEDVHIVPIPASRDTSKLNQLARDLCHPGEDWNESVTDVIVSQLRDKIHLR